MNFLKSKRRLLLMGIDLGIFIAVYALTVLVMAFLDNELFTYIKPLGYICNAAIIYFCVLTARIVSGVYSNMWRYSNSLLFIRLVVADAIGGLIGVFVTHLIPYVRIGAWRGCALVAMVDVMTLVSRFVYQYYHRQNNVNHDRSNITQIPVAIVGAGQIGTLLAEELLFDKNSKYKPVFFIDRDSGKVGVNLLGLRVISNNDDVIEKIKSSGVEQVFIAISDLGDDKIKSFYEFYSQAGCKVKIYDFPIKEDGSDDVGKKRIIRDVRIEDLLFRDTLQVVDDSASLFYRGKTVLVTGGGGSIGSELSRQIAACGPKKLIILDIYENNAYDVQQELTRRYGDSLDLSVEIASVRDRARLDAIFAHYRPEVVFHAAAHKHVPLMEHSNCEAIKNNVFGTYNTADMAEKYGAEKFILISTDKAVNPTNVMGASKRLCEMVIQCRSDSKTVFSAVRFGNVLGSNGSVIPLFRRQIEAGGPVTITDKRIIRYFMTIPEASGLVMQAGAMAQCGELFVLDMGKPVKIIELATNMIKLSGLTPYIDIDIVETGLRPGEKLYEELLIKTEKLDKTENNLIFIEHDTPLTREEMEKNLDTLRAVITRCEGEIASPEITEAMKCVVSTFRSPEEVNSTATESNEMRLVGSV
ncbi:MAG: polysaccharide biosynthesis protein [Clostridia bacterium]|nr:polysaccharide biosynthesis protein [Clostridia bacterium]